MLLDNSLIRNMKSEQNLEKYRYTTNEDLGYHL